MSVQIEISDALAAALKLRATTIKRRNNDSGEAGVGTYDEALAIVLRENKAFARLYDDMGGAWPVWPKDGAK